MGCVTEAVGHPPTGPDDLIGATTVTVEIDGHDYRLIGAGVKHGQIVLFQQKEARVGSGHRSGVDDDRHRRRLVPARQQ